MGELLGRMRLIPTNRPEEAHGQQRGPKLRTRQHPRRLWLTPTRPSNTVWPRSPMRTSELIYISSDIE
jgi:hypothetical protein